MPGSVRLRDCEILQNITRKQAEENRLYGAICAAPAVTLLPWGLLRRKQVHYLILFYFIFYFYFSYNFGRICAFQCMPIANVGVVCPARQLATLHSWTSFRPSGLSSRIFKFLKGLQQAGVLELHLNLPFA